MSWQPMETAPRNGKKILVCRDNGFSWEYYEVWWTGHPFYYPWKSYNNAYPDARFDYWRHRPAPPYKIGEVDLWGQV